MYLTDHIHFIGMAGIGMSAVAKIALLMNFKVSGSDIVCNDRIEALEKLGAVFFQGHGSKNISNGMTAVYSSAISFDNPEIQTLKEKGLKILHRSEFIREIFNHKKIVAITGCHGKTTTTGITASIFFAANLKPSILAGGILHGTGNTNAFLGEGDWLILEADESDGSILNVNADISLITNIDDDHLSFYGSIENMLVAYRTFISNGKSGSIAVIGENHYIGLKMQTYGFSEESDFQVLDVDKRHNGSFFRIKFPNEKISDKLFVKIPGMHNVLNACAAASAAYYAGISISAISDGICSFSGVFRRFSLIKKLFGIKFFLDYAHNAAEIRALAESAHLASQGNKTIAIIRPYRFSRMKHVLNEFAEACSFFDFVIITEICSCGEKPVEGVSGQELVTLILKRIPDRAFFADKKADIASVIMRLSNPQCIVVFSGLGDTDYMARDILKVIETNY